ncbi:MAG: Dabb family protein [Chloroflexi bacterium]|nr:Dabb family protein [Chloroflexota bacterium]
MITHIVVAKLNDPTDKNIETAVATLRTLDGNIEVLRSLVVGRDKVHAARSYDIGLIATFDNMADLKIYAEHPVHVPVSDYLKSVASSIVAVDFES